MTENWNKDILCLDKPTERSAVMCDQDQAVQILGEVHRACSPVFGGLLKDAYLYGSYARGDFHAESDIDIFLTVDLEQPELSKYRNALAEITSDLSLKHDVTVSVTVKSFKQFQRYANVLPFYKNVIKEGILYGA